LADAFAPWPEATVIDTTLDEARATSVGRAAIDGPQR
jgi:hypothetical protein